MRDVNLLINNGVNVKKSLELFGDMATYDDTLGDFLQDINEKEMKIKQTKENGDMANYAILVHGLKSDAKYFGFDKLAELAYNHEMASKENNMYYVTEHFDELITELDRIVHLVKQYLGMEEIGTATTFVAPKKDRALIVVDDSAVIRAAEQQGEFMRDDPNSSYQIGLTSSQVASTTTRPPEQTWESMMDANATEASLPKVDTDSSPAVSTNVYE